MFAGEEEVTATKIGDCGELERRRRQGRRRWLFVGLERLEASCESKKGRARARARP
jgi:hypothetical protein